MQVADNIYVLKFSRLKMFFIWEYAKQRENQPTAEGVGDNEAEKIPPMSIEQSKLLPCREETHLGLVEYESVTNALTINEGVVKKYTHYSDEDRYKIGRYASHHGASAVARKFSENYPKLKENTIRGFFD